MTELLSFPMTTGVRTINQNWQQSLTPLSSKFFEIYTVITTTATTTTAITITTTTTTTTTRSIITSPEIENTGSKTSGTSHQLGNQLILYAFPFVLLLGTVGNVLSLVVLQRKAMKRNCSSVYLSALAVADIIVLYLSGFKTWIRVVTGFELLHSSDGACRLTKYAFYSSTHFSAWIIVVITFERFLVVYTPFRASTMWLVRRPQLMTLTSGLVIMVVNSNILWMSQLVQLPGDGPSFCASYSCDSFVCAAFPKFNLLVYSALPSVLVFTFNIFIIVVIFKNFSSSESVKTVTGSQFRRHGHQQRLTLTLLTLSTLWMVLSLPYSLIDSKVDVLIRLKIPLFVRVVCYMMMYLNHSLNFYIYCLLGQKFRTELKRTFGFKPYNKVTRLVAQSSKRQNRIRNVLNRPKLYIDNLYN